MDKQATGLRKRQQIGQANKMMLLWIAAVSVVVGISVVLVLFLVQKIVFEQKVVNAKSNTAKILSDNLKAVDGLKEQINVLNTNEALKSTALDSSKPIQSVLDALPADPNATALASSLQMKLLTGVPGVVIETIAVDQVSDDTASGVDEIPFSFAVSVGNDSYASLRDVLERLEKSIRPFKVTTLTVETQGNKVVMTAKGVSYYEPAKTVKLSEKVVRP